MKVPSGCQSDETPSPPDSLRDQAVRWIVRLKSGSVAAQDRQAFEAWLAESPDHRREFERVSKMWTELDEAQPLLHAEIERAEHLWTRHEASRFAHSTRAWWSIGAQAATAAAVILLSVSGWWWWTFVPEVTMFETAIGAQRQVALADGSTVTLNTDTQLAVEYSRRARLIRLIRGEAWFVVQHEEQRPFTVDASHGVIHDIGTEFIVRQSPAQVKVSVLIGAVEVGVHASGEIAASPQPTVLHDGEQVSFGPAGLLSDVALFDVDTAGSWKEGTLIFRQQPLKQVLAEIARYRSEEIRLIDSSLEHLPVSGVFHIHDLDNVLPFLEDGLPIRAQRVRDNLIIVERAPASSARSVHSHH